MIDPRQPVFQHTRTTRGEGLRTILRGVVVCGSLFAMPFIMDAFDSHGEPSALFYSLWTMICGGFLCLLVVGYVLPNLRMKGQFKLSVFQDRIECESPHPSFGPSYRIDFRDIQFIEHDTSGDGATFSIVTLGGERVRLNHNYGNPVHRIVSLIQFARPELEYRRVT